jgi:hypothetical protein
MRMHKLLLIIAVLSALILALPAISQSSDSAGKPAKAGISSGVYIIQMSQAPVVAYEGEIKGYKATSPAKGKKIDPNNADVIRYVGYLDGWHKDALTAVGGGSKLYDYRYAFNGFAAKLTEAQADRMKRVSGVLAVSKDELQYMDTSSTPAFLGLDAPGGLWDQVGGVRNAGEGLIIGMIDSGIWPESLSFSDRIGTNGNASKAGKLDYHQIPGWHGKCVPGEAFNASLCNQKLIGAQYFNQGYGGDAGIDADLPWEFNSVRDYNGHGTHTSSTAGGNNGVPATGQFEVFGSISGMAPRARIAMYKALWSL